jgi:F-type H+-transporting ATPase subunit delta
MRNTKAATRYAKSLLDLAIEQKVLEDVKGDIRVILDTVEGSDELRMLIDSKIIQEDKKVTLYDSIFADKISNLTQGFMRLIAKHNRSAIIPDICRFFEIHYNDYKRILTVEVISATPLTDEARKKVTSSINMDGWNELKLVERVDASLIGGLIIRSNNTQIDQSVASRLKALKQEFSNEHFVAQY